MTYNFLKEIEGVSHTTVNKFLEIRLQSEQILVGNTGKALS